MVTSTLTSDERRFKHDLGEKFNSLPRDVSDATRRLNLDLPFPGLVGLIRYFAATSTFDYRVQLSETSRGRELNFSPKSCLNLRVAFTFVRVLVTTRPYRRLYGLVVTSTLTPLPMEYVRQVY